MPTRGVINVLSCVCKKPRMIQYHCNNKASIPCDFPMVVIRDPSFGRWRMTSFMLVSCNSIFARACVNLMKVDVDIILLMSVNSSVDIGASILRYTRSIGWPGAKLSSIQALCTSTVTASQVGCGTEGLRSRTCSSACRINPFAKTSRLNCAITLAITSARVLSVVWHCAAGATESSTAMKAVSRRYVANRCWVIRVVRMMLLAINEKIFRYGSRGSHGF